MATKITTTEARKIVNSRLEILNEHICSTKAEPDYSYGDERYWYTMACGIYEIVKDLGVLTSADELALWKKIWAARENCTEIKLLGQR